MSLSYVLKRLAASILVLWVLITIMFALTLLLPGGMESHYASGDLEQADRDEVESDFAVDEGLASQYVSWTTNYATLNFGYSTQSAEPVEDVIFRRLPRTIALFGTAFLINYTLGTIAGIHFGWERGSVKDRVGFLSGLSMYSVPFFWIGWMFILFFAFDGLGTDAFPMAHMTTPFQAEFTALQIMGDIAYHLFLPAISLVFVGWAAAMLITRTAMQDVVSKPYIRTARAKGLTETEIKYKHAGRNALIPVVTQGVISIAFIFDGAIVVEELFSWPGMGELMVSAIMQQDYPVAMAAFFMFGILVVALRLLTDVLYTYIDPRIKFGDKG